MVNIESQRQLTAEECGRQLCKHDLKIGTSMTNTKGRTSWLTLINDLG